MNAMTGRSGVYLLLAVSMALGACASSPGADVRVDQAETPPRCQRFDWLPASSDAASLTEQRVRAAVTAKLQEKGYEVSADNPDCKITYVLAMSERPKPKPRIGVGAGGGSGGFGGGIGVSLPIGRNEEQSGTFTLDVVDVANKAQVWSGSIDATFERGDLTEEEAQKAADVVLDRYPDRQPMN